MKNKNKHIIAKKEIIKGNKIEADSQLTEVEIRMIARKTKQAFMDQSSFNDVTTFVEIEV